MSARKLLWPENGEMTSLGFELQDDVLYLEDHAFNVASVFSGTIVSPNKILLKQTM